MTSPIKSKALKTKWFTYILLCKDGTLYTGITTDLDKRLQAHKDGTAAKYTRSRGADKIVYFKKHPIRSSASIHESQIKKLSRKEKVNLIN